MKLGDLEIKLVNAGNIPMDGGAMFGVVPKVIWRKLESVDENNQIAFASNCLLIVGHGFKALLETGHGSKNLPSRANLPSMHTPTSDQADHPRDIVDALRVIGVDAMDIDLVINTHYHSDHCGGNTSYDSTGILRPSFPKARYVVQKGEWETANDPDDRSRSGYSKDDFRPIKEAGLLYLAEGEEEILPGIRVIPTPGHTFHHQVVLVSGGGEQAIFFGDLVPTSSHIRIPYIAAYDLLPLESMRIKKELYSRAIEENWLAIWAHDTKTGAGYMDYDEKGRPRVREFVVLT